MNQLQKVMKNNPQAIHIVPFGGCGEFGMNLTAYIIDSKLLIVDCGIMFSESSKLGTDALYPDVNPWFKDLGGVDCYCITHGHEDHVGAIAQILPSWQAPVFCSEWTLAIIQRKLKHLGYDPKQFDLRTVEPNSIIQRNTYSVEWVHLNHSIPQSMGLFIQSKHGNIFHTGDFKIDLQSELESPAAVQRLKELGRTGCDLVLADSTNAHQPGMCPGESQVKPSFEKIFSESKSRIIVTSFASNLWRIQSLTEVAKKTGRLICLVGRGMQNSLEIAQECSIWREADQDVLIDEDQALQCPDEKLVLLATGSQGEPNSALTRMVHEDHRSFSVKQEDLVVFSSRVIPGNEKAFFHVASCIEKIGAASIHWKSNPSIHVSGHGYRGDLSVLLECLKPDFFVPLHGTYFHLKQNQQNANLNGLREQNSMIMTNGDILSFSKENGLQKTGNIEIEHRFIDSFSKYDLDYPQLRDRLRIGELGGIFISCAVDPYNLSFLADPDIALFGIATGPSLNVEEFKALLSQFVQEEVETYIEENSNYSDDEISEEIRRKSRRYAETYLQKKPYVYVKIFLLK